MEIIFLGTGGGRWTTLLQRLRTGGFRIHSDHKIHIDPGPGAIVALKMSQINPMDTNSVIVTHCHPDHYNDAEMLIEAMTRGMTTKRGILAASESILVGIDKLGPAISNYHQSKVEKKVILKPGNTFEIGEIEAKCLPTKHSDPTGVGVKFYFEEGTVTYTSDTEYFEGISQHYEDSEVLIFNVIRPKNERIPWHFCTNDVIKICREAKPKLAIIQHFGMKMIGIEDSEAERVEKETGVNTIAAKDGLQLKL